MRRQRRLARAETSPATEANMKLLHSLRDAELFCSIPLVLKYITYIYIYIGRMLLLNVVRGLSPLSRARERLSWGSPPMYPRPATKDCRAHSIKIKINVLVILNDIYSNFWPSQSNKLT